MVTAVYPKNHDIKVSCLVKNDDTTVRTIYQSFKTMANAWSYINHIRQSRMIGSNTVIGLPTIEG